MIHRDSLQAAAFSALVALASLPVFAAEGDGAPPVEMPAATAPSQITGSADGGEGGGGADGADSAPAPRSRKSRSSKGKGPREKEADGTEARNRFKADPVLKSHYQLNGEPLEVDPD